MKSTQISIAKPGSKSTSILSTAFLRKILAGAGGAWNWNSHKILILWSVPFIILLAGITAALIGKDLYKLFVSEDGIGESLQVVFYALAFVISLRISRIFWRAGDKLLAILYAGFSLALFFMIGEELSWGQRVFGWQTTETLASANKQGETNLHNIYGVGDTFKWVQMLVGAYGSLLPVVFLFVHPRGRLGNVIQRVIPHFSLIPYFLPMFFWRLFRNFYEPPQRYYFAISEYNEVVELVLAIGFFLFAIYQLKRLRSKDAGTKRYSGGVQRV